MFTSLIHFIEIYIATKHVFQLQKCGPVIHPELCERLRFQIILHDWLYSFDISRYSLKHLSQISDRVTKRITLGLQIPVHNYFHV